MRVTGGARIGWLNATWPLATFAASSQQLSVSLRMFGQYSFSPDEIAALEPYGSLPFFSRGVRIVHVRPDYPDKIIFWCFGSPDKLIQRVYSTGFRPTASVAQLPQRHGIPLRWSFVLVCLAVWNLLFLADRSARPEGREPGPLIFLALAFVFATAVVLGSSRRFQSLVLKPGRSIFEIRPFVFLVQVVAGLMLLAFLLRWVT